MKCKKKTYHAHRQTDTPHPPPHPHTRKSRVTNAAQILSCDLRYVEDYSWFNGALHNRTWYPTDDMHSRPRLELNTRPRFCPVNNVCPCSNLLDRVELHLKAVVIQFGRNVLPTGHEEIDEASNDLGDHRDVPDLLLDQEVG